MARAFAGPLCRFFAGDRGEPLTFQQGVLDWRRDLQRALGANLAAPLDWSEDPTAPGHWSDLGAAGLVALRLFAFYAERSDLDLPDTVPALLELDRDYRAAADGKFARSLYGQLLACRCWLPVEFGFTARVPLPDGEFAEVGSLPVLRDQLRWLNQRTFAADQAQLVAWRALPADPGGALLPAAQRGLAGLWAAVAAAERTRWPAIVLEVEATV